MEIAPGRRLNLYCSGRGTPTVILDAGGGERNITWRYVQPAIAKLTQVCSYDRAGLGFSDPGALPRDTVAMVDDLHALLKAADLKPPYIFVGHSMAGLNGVLFADRYLPALSGMLLVDPSIANQRTLFSQIPGVAALLPQLLPHVEPCEEMAKSGKMPTDPKVAERCLLDQIPGYGPALIAAIDGILLRPSFWQSFASEYDSAGGETNRDSEELGSAIRNFGALDLVVLTAGNNRLPGLSQEKADGVFKVINEGRREIAARSSRGVNELVPDSGHYIQIEHPQLVIDHIDRMVLSYRNVHQQ